MSPSLPSYTKTVSNSYMERPPCMSPLTSLGFLVCRYTGHLGKADQGRINAVHTKTCLEFAFCKAKACGMRIGPERGLLTELLTWP